MFPAEGEKRQAELLKNKSGQERLKAAFNLNKLVRRIMTEGITNQNPCLSSQEIKKQIQLRTQE